MEVCSEKPPPTTKPNGRFRGLAVGRASGPIHDERPPEASCDLDGRKRSLFDVVAFARMKEEWSRSTRDEVTSCSRSSSSYTTMVRLGANALKRNGPISSRR